MREIDAIHRELVEIMDRLEALLPDDRSERAWLHDRRRELRARAQALADSDDLEQLRARRLRLERQLGAAGSRILSVSSMGTSGESAGIDPYEFMQLNRQILDGAGVAELAAELEQVRARIARAEAEDSEPRDADW